MIKRKIANRLFNNLLAIVFCGATSTTKHNKVQFHKMPTCYDSCYFVDFVVL